MNRPPNVTWVSPEIAARMACPLPPNTLVTWTGRYHRQDAQRAKVYRAERLAFTVQWARGGPDRNLVRHDPGLDVDYRDLATTQAALDRILADPRFRAAFPWFRVPPELRKGRGNYYRRISHSITLTPWGMRNWVLLHELAHAVTVDSVVSHGRDFAQAYLKLVGLFMGPEAEHALRRRFVLVGVRHRGTDLAYLHRLDVKRLRLRKGK